MIPGCTHAIDIALDDASINLNEATDIYVSNVSLAKTKLLLFVRDQETPAHTSALAI